MADKKEIQQGITRRETKTGASGLVLEEKVVQVYGKDLKECTEILKEEWNRK